MSLYLFIYLFIYGSDFVLWYCQCHRVVVYGVDDRMADDCWGIGKDVEEVSMTFLILFICYDVMLTEWLIWFNDAS